MLVLDRRRARRRRPWGRRDRAAPRGPAGGAPRDVGALIEAARGRSAGGLRYEDGRGHPLWFGREVFAELRGLHGDKAVWKLLADGGRPVVEVEEAATVPLDVDTWEDYETLVALDRANLGG